MPANLRYIFNLESQFYFISWVVNLTKKNKISFFEFNRILRRVLLTKVRSQINEAGCFNFKNVLISQGVLHSRKSLVPVHISFRKKNYGKSLCWDISGASDKQPWLLFHITWCKHSNWMTLDLEKTKFMPNLT